MKKEKSSLPRFDRITFLVVFFLLLGTTVVAQLFRIQVLHSDVYASLADDQYTLSRSIEPQRGEFFWQDISTNETPSLVINRPVYTLYGVPKNSDDPARIAGLFATILESESEPLLSKFAKRDDPYEAIQSGLTTRERDALLAAANAAGIPEVAYGFSEEFERYYLESNLVSQVTGFVGFDEAGTTRSGQYGLEEYFDVLLQGEPGVLFGDTDVQGRPIGVGDRIVEQAVNGKDVVITIDKNIQYRACNVLERYVKDYDAEGGLVVIMDPATGSIYALCNVPDFDPNDYGSSPPRAFINTAIGLSYEPGSIFKPITMAAALDVAAVTPWTTFQDTGAITIDRFTIRNSDGKAHGINSMVDVLDKSLNTGAIFAMRAAGPDTLKAYVHRFGFGKLTGIELAGEADGDVSPLEINSEIYAATASFGQGITVTPIQLVTAYAAIARGGRLVKPRLVDRIMSDENKEVVAVYEAEEVISPQTAETLSLMLVSAVKNGYARKAGVSGYQIAGKTGTAQIPKSDGPGYSEDTFHSFIGFGPVGEHDPVFVMLVRLDKPTAVRFSSDSAAPLFGEIAEFLLGYFEVPPEE